MEIKNSLEWNEVRSALLVEMSQIGFNADLNKMLTNISGMVKSLSIAEVDARRLHNKKNLVAPLESINKSIKHLEQFLIMAKLMK